MAPSHTVRTMTPHFQTTPHDRPLGYHWRVSPELVEKLGLSPGIRDAAKRARRSIVAELALAAETDQPSISYSRTRDWYAGGGHYPGCDYTYDTVVPAVDELIEAGLVIEKRGLVREGGSGIQSTMRASALFLERLGGALAVEHVAPRTCLLMRGEDGRMMPLPRTEEVRRMLRGIEAANEGVHDIRVSVSPKAQADDWRFGERHWQARKIDKNGCETWAHVLPTPHQYLVQILGRGRTDCHGRLYAWYLGLPKVRRRELLLNDGPVEEPDFDFIHPYLLYTIVGARLEGDPYVTDVHDRDHNKLALNVGINAKGGRTGAIQAIANHKKWRGWGLSYEHAGEVYDQVSRRNPAIAQYLGSDAGVRLMGIDSRMCMQVLKRCRKEGIAALPVHDSFIVPEQHKGTVQAIMEEVLHATSITISPGGSSTSAKSIRHTPGASPVASSPVSPPVAAPAPSAASPVPRALRWDPAERLKAMVAYQINVERAEMAQDRREGIVEVWERREARARETARSVCADENATGMRAFPLRIVPDRLGGTEKSSPKVGRSPRKSGSTVRGRRPRVTPFEARA